jgi:hypothetical protein
VLLYRLLFVLNNLLDTLVVVNSVASQDGRLHCCAVCHDLLAWRSIADGGETKHVSKEQLEPWDLCGASAEHDVMRLRRVETGCQQRICYKCQAFLEYPLAQAFQIGSGEACVEIAMLSQ